MNKVWLTGDAVVDLIPDTTTTYLKCPGGAPANVAVGIARLGGDVSFFGRVGADPFGRFLAQTLRDEKINIDHLHFDSQARTSTVVVDLDEQGERSFTFMVKPSADQFTQLSDIPNFKPHQWLHTCSIALANEPSRATTFAAMRNIKSAGGFVSFDPNLRPEVWAHPEQMIPTVMQAVALADVVKFSDDEAMLLTHQPTLAQAIIELERLAIPLVLITQGAKGALVIHRSSSELIAGNAVKPVDTTGAGDAFVGGLLAYLAQVQDWQQPAVITQAVQWANACGALATTQKGAMTALPTQSQLQAYLTQHTS